MTAAVPAGGTRRPLAPQSRTELSPAARVLADLLPGVYTSRNETVDGRPLYLLLEVLAAPLADLEAAVDQLRDDHFVERASPEALPLLADLVGARLLGDDTRTNRGVVARTVGWRRRKGTPATLAEVLRVTSGWDAEVDEAFRSLLQTQDLAHPAPWRGLVAVLTDPIALADPLTRRAPAGMSPRRGPEPSPLVRLPGEDVEQALARIGRADAGRPAASPRTVDLLGWARLEHAVIATGRIDQIELERVEIGVVRDVVRRDEPGVAFAGAVLDPGGQDQPLVGRTPLVAPDTFAGLTDLHEPDPPAPPAGHAAGMLTPTGLALDPDAAERADSLSVFVDDVRLAGGDPVPAAGEDLGMRPVGPDPLLRFADAGRPGPGEDWTLHLVAIGDPATIAADVIAAEPTGAVTAANPALVRSVVRRGDRDPEQSFEATQVPRAGATIAIRLQRSGTAQGHRRRPEVGWEQFDIGERSGEPASDVTTVVSAGTRLVVRWERNPGGGFSLASWRPDAPVSRWTSRRLALDALPAADRPAEGADGPGLSALGLADGTVVVVGTASGTPGGTPGTLGVWRVPDPLAPTPVLERLDSVATPGRRRPPGRVMPSLCVHDGRLHVFGGQDGDRVLGDLWSIATSGAGAGRWTAHVVRRRQWRTCGRLLSTAGGLVLLGGATVGGTLDSSVWRADLTRARPAWEPLAGLPITPDRPGAAWARLDPGAAPGAAAVEVLVWADRTAPVLLRHDAARDRWAAGAPEPAAPNPPAEGEGIFLGGEFTVVGPPPLPPSEVVFRLGGQGQLAFLPAVDLPSSGAAALFGVRDDASTDRWFAPGEVARPSLRLGAGRAAPTARRVAPAARLGVPGRLGWAPLRLRQVNLGRWDTPLALDLDGRIGVDPRLGRVLVPAALGGGRLTVSFRVGRASAIGAGFAGSGRAAAALPDAWTAPGEVVPVPPAGAAGVTAWVSPRQAGITGADGVPVVPDFVAGLLIGSDAGTSSLGVLGSPRLPAQALAAGQAQVVSVWPADTGALPHVLAAGGVSLSLHERPADQLDTPGPRSDTPGSSGDTPDTEDPDLGPSWFFAGLSAAGAVELVVAAGDLDLRWCTLAVPGELALTVAGAGHAPPLLRHTLPVATVRVRLYGCRLGRVELPPWVRLTAAGCTFDAGARDAVAIAAAGADIQLRHCTVQGQTLAGRLAASSSVFTGAVTCDRPDAGWVRYSVLAPGGRPPAAFRSVRHRASFGSIDPNHPLHLALAANNPAAVLAAGELGRTPGAHADLAARLRELVERAEDFLPLALVAHHVDAAAADLERMR